jgi:hypothetical protein
LDSSAQAFVPSPSASLTPSAEPSSPDTGQVFRCTQTLELFPGSAATSSRRAFRASHSALPPGAETTRQTCGPQPWTLSERSGRLGSLLRTSLESDMAALTGYAVISRLRVTPAGRSIWTLRYRKGSECVPGSSGWPTPTAKANHDAPSMRKWPAYARYQDAVKRTTARLWEWMMDFPAGWTDCANSETPLPRSPLSSSDGPL